ncbi:MAG: ComEC/Rec2 family competence protein [Bacteroidales bacterium]|nr:ComEC/Rec2 family competence protein [Bacteroidales bacterium]
MRARSRPLRLFSNSPLLWLLLPMMVGIALAEVFYVHLAGVFLPLVGSAFVLWLCSLFALRLSPERASFIIVSATAMSVMLLGAALLVLERGRSEITWTGAPQIHRVMVMDSPKERPASVQFTGRLMQGERAGELVRWRLMKPKGETLKDGLSKADKNKSILRPGDVVLCRTTIEAPRNNGNPGEFDYAAWLRRQGVTGTAFCFVGEWQCSDSLYSGDMPLSVRALRLRSQLVERYANHFSGRDLAVLSALTLGEKGGLDDDTRDLYSQTGVSHVLALSGLHLSILFSVFQLLVLSLCRSRRWLYVAVSLVGLLGLWVFALLAGFPISLVRAAIMFSAMQLAGILQRDSLSVNNLALAATLILLISPQALFDIGFQLSCLSVLSILIVAVRLPSPSFVARRRWLQWCYDLVKVSLVAQLVTAPLVAYYFHTFPVYGLLANLVAVPLTYFILTLAILFFVFPFLQGWLALLLGLLLRGMDTALTAITELPYAVLTFHPTALTTAACYVIFAILLLMCRPAVAHLRLRYATAAASVFVLCVAFETYTRRSSRLAPQIIFYNLYTTAPIHFISSASRSYLWLSEEKTAEENPSEEKSPADEKTERAKTKETTQITAHLSGELDYIRETFWEAEALAPPVVYTDTLSRPDLSARMGISLFGGRRVAVLRGPLPKNRLAVPFAVDYLLLDRGCRAPLSAILAHFRPKTLILSGALSDYYCQSYRAAALSAHIPLHDMATDGALRVMVGETDK